MVFLQQLQQNLKFLLKKLNLKIQIPKTNNKTIISLVGNNQNLIKIIQQQPLQFIHHPTIHQNPFTQSNFLNSSLIIFQLDPILHYHLLLQQLKLIKSIYQPVIILFDSPIPNQFIKSHLLNKIPLTNYPHHQILFIDSKAAIDAIHQFEHNNHRAIDQINQSGLSQLNRAIQATLSSSTTTDQLSTLSIAQLNLNLASQQLLKISQDLNHASQTLYQYQINLQELQLALTKSLSSQHSTLSQSTLFHRFKKQIGFFKLPFVSDQIALRALKIIEESGLDEIEKKLIFQAGQVKVLQQNAQKLINSLLNDPVLESFRTESMVNRVLQSRTKDLLVHPHHQDQKQEEIIRQNKAIRIFQDRKRLLVGPGGPLEALQNKASKILANNLFLGIGIGFFSYSPSLLSHHTLLPFNQIGFELPAFLIVSAVWFSQSSWIRALNQFTNDFLRWNASLNSHLQEHHQRLVQQTFRLSVTQSSSLDHRQEQQQQEEEEDEELISSIRKRIHSKLDLPKDLDLYHHPDPHLPRPTNLIELTQLVQRQLDDIKHILFTSPPQPPSSSATTTTPPPPDLK